MAPRRGRATHARRSPYEKIFMLSLQMKPSLGISLINVDDPAEPEEGTNDSTVIVSLGWMYHSSSLSSASKVYLYFSRPHSCFHWPGEWRAFAKVRFPGAREDAELDSCLFIAIVTVHGSSVISILLSNFRFHLAGGLTL